MDVGRQRAQLERTSPTLVAERYRRFAEREARGRSLLYERFALGVAGDQELLERLPPAKQQPNLLFAAVLCLGGRQPDFNEGVRDASTRDTSLTVRGVRH
jgi:hypothetical protein